MNNRKKLCLVASFGALLPVLGASCSSAEPEHPTPAAPPSTPPSTPPNTPPNTPSTPPSDAGTGGSSPSPAATPSTAPSTNAPPSMSAAPTPSASAGGATQPSNAGVGFSAKVLSVSGSGCPGGSATITATTADSLTLSIPAYSARLGGEATPAEKRRNCSLLFDVSVPAGYTYTMTSASLSGTAALATGVMGSAATTYSFTGSAESAANAQPINNGTNKWTSPGVFSAASLVYAPCGAPTFLSVNTSLVLTGEGETESNISMDPSVTLTLALRKCQ